MKSSDLTRHQLQKQNESFLMPFEYMRNGGCEERFDELCLPDGSIRQHWIPVIDLLSKLTPSEIESRLASAQQHIRDEGITYTIYADPKGKDRPWALDELPLVLSSEEWGDLSFGLAQRARLLNLILADFYGPQKLLLEGIIPPEVVYGSGEWLPAAFGTKPPGNIFLHSYAADLLRAPDGQWWVAADRTQAPSGSGYALENRLVMARAFPELIAQMSVASLTDYFSSLRKSLVFHSPCDDETARVVVLTPGPLNETYYEHSLLSRYLGFPLVEGGDLIVRDGYVWLKTINGLQRIHGILRRQDDSYCDPLELKSDSALGVAGLAECARRGTVFVANALGSGVVESTALQGFLPAACRFLLGEELVLPSVATWWCGEKVALEYVRQNLEDLVIKPVDRFGAGVPIFGQDLDEEGRHKIMVEIESYPEKYVAQEWVRLSQSPVLNRQSGSFQLEARSVGLRAYAIAGVQGYEVMPGGLTRVESHSNARVVSMQRGGLSKDTLVIQEKRNNEISFYKDVPVDSKGGLYTGVPSRVAENLYWMGRYTERGEGIARLLRQTLNESLHDARPPNLNGLYELVWRCGLVDRLDRANDRLDISTGPLISCATNPSHSQGLCQTLQHLGRVGFSLRDRISHDHWRAINRLVNDRIFTSNATLVAVFVWLDRAVAGLAAISGFSLDAMNRDAGWRFLSLGRRLERLQLLTLALDVAIGQIESGNNVRSNESIIPFDWLLDLTDAAGSFRNISTGLASWYAIQNVVLLDASNPRSLRFQIEGVRQALRRLGEEAGGNILGFEETGIQLAEWSVSGIPDIPMVHNFFKGLSKEAGELNELLINKYFSVSELGVSLL